jgi:hypothetical protein
LADRNAEWKLEGIKLWIYSLKYGNLLGEQQQNPLAQFIANCGGIGQEEENPVENGSWEMAKEGKGKEICGHHQNMGQQSGQTGLTILHNPGRK